MFIQYFLSIQQDIKLFLFFPILCAVFRAVFIKVYCPYDTLQGRWRVVWHCFRYGFWWGMDFNAYVFLLSMIGISLPGLFVPFYEAAGNAVRLGAGLMYATVLYAAFAGKMIFYKHFHDIYNHVLRLGVRAEKHNLADIFFNQDHGALILLGLIPFWIVSLGCMLFLLSLPSVPYPLMLSGVWEYVFNTAVVLAVIIGFYWFRYGGTLSHDDKPEWDTIPSIVKRDIFFAKAAADDLVSLEQVMKRKLNDAYRRSDEEDLQSIRTVQLDGRNIETYPNPVYAFLRKAKGPRISAPPSRIFLIVGESYLQQFFDPAFACLNLVSGGRKLMNDSHTAFLPNALSAGVISRPSIVSLMSGIFDSGLELNENEAFWKGTVPTAFPLQLKRLGYHSTYWYGGNVTYGNFNQFAPACGFDRVMTATDFCGPKAPKTWVGVYDNVFLEKTAELMQQSGTGRREFHMVYTTSYHGPFKIPLKQYGYCTEDVMPEAPADIRHDKALQKNLGTFWFADRALGTFIETLRCAYPDALIIVTGDHAVAMTELEKTSLMKRACTIRERHSPVLMMNHREIDQRLFSGNTIGSHMNIMPTVLELIAPAGFSYYSLFPPLTEKLDHVVTPYHWLRPDAYGTYENDFYQPLGQIADVQDVMEGPQPYRDERQAWQDLTGYMVRHPELLEPAAALLEKLC